MNEFIGWVAMIEVPIFISLFRLIGKFKREVDNDLLSTKQKNEHSVATIREALADFKLHVARNYVSINYLKDVENRLTDHLLRIEKKLDEVGRNK